MDKIVHSLDPDDEKTKYSTRLTAILYLFAALIVGGCIVLVIFLTGSKTFNNSSNIDPSQLKAFPNLQTGKEVPAGIPDSGGSVAGVNSDSNYGPQLPNKKATPARSAAGPTPSPTIAPSPTPAPSPTLSPEATSTPTPSPEVTPSPTPSPEATLLHQHQPLHLLLHLHQLQVQMRHQLRLLVP